MFSAPVVASDSEKYGASEPVIVADSSGRLVVAWCDWTPPRPRLRVATSSNGGVSFAPSTAVLADDPSHGDGQADVSLARTADGRVFLSWLACRHDDSAPTASACDIYVRSSRDMGRTWGAVAAIVEGGPAHRERDWLVAGNGRVYASWTENLSTGVAWVASALDSSGRFAPLAHIPARASLAPLSVSSAGLEAYLLDRSPHDPTKVLAERRRSDDGGRSWAVAGTIVFDRSAALLPYSMGLFASSPSGEGWLAIPRGGGDSNDFVLAHRGPGRDIFRTAATLRASEGARVGMPWISPFVGGMLAVWIEEHADGWRVMGRTLLDDRRRSDAVDLGRAPFRFEEASLTQNIGDYLSIASAGESAWVAWSDTRRGRAEIRVVRVTPATSRR